VAKKKKSSKSLTEGLERVFDKLAAKLPDNINVDAAKFAQMGLAGAATYVFAEDMVKQAAIIAAEFGKLGGDAAAPQPWFLGMLIGGPIGAIIGKMIEGEGITEEEQVILDTYKLTEEQRIALACGVAALVPMTPEIIKGLGEIAKGIGEVVPG